MTFRVSSYAAGALAMLTLAGFGSAATAQTSETGKLAVARGGATMFEHRCRSCHASDAAQKSYGPPLTGVIGRKAGIIPGFEYSDALKASGITWTEPALRAWIANNDGLLPGTRMRHVGITDPIEQDMLIAYLKELSK